jgi:ABC-2 type transport system permease protein
MNRALVGRLIMKDWYLNWGTLAVIALAGSLSIGVLYLRGETTAFLGFSAALIAAIFLSILLPMQTVVNERKKQNLPFVMSLPISPMEYTTAKVLGNLSAFLVVWLAIVIGVVGTIARAGVHGGLIPVALVVALAPFVAFCLLLAVAIVLESETWAMVMMGTCNLSYTYTWFYLLRVPGLKEDLRSPVAVWSQPIVSILGVELAMIVLALGLTFYLQSRKRDFI